MAKTFVLWFFYVCPHSLVFLLKRFLRSPWELANLLKRSLNDLGIAFDTELQVVRSPRLAFPIERIGPIEIVETAQPHRGCGCDQAIHDVENKEKREEADVLCGRRDEEDNDGGAIEG